MKIRSIAVVKMAQMGLVLACVLASVGAHAQSSDSTGVAAGTPPLPSGVWDPNSASTGLSSVFTNINSQISSGNSTLSTAQSNAASGVGGSVGLAQLVSPTDGGTITAQMICTTYSIQYRSSYYSGCPASAPYATTIFEITNVNWGGGG